jgi:Lrp/AsnC family transcriptional regulator
LANDAEGILNFSNGGAVVYQLDSIDARILELIQRDASLSVAEIADQIGLSASPCWRRIKRMEEEGIIEKRVTILNAEKLGLEFEVYAAVKLAMPTRENLQAFEEAMEKNPEVIDLATVTGAVDYMMRVVTTDIRSYDDFLRDRVLSLNLVADVQSRIVVRRAKASTVLPLALSHPHLKR